MELCRDAQVAGFVQLQVAGRKADEVIHSLSAARGDDAGTTLIPVM